MAKETTKVSRIDGRLVLAVVALLLSMVGAVVGIAWAGGGRLTKVEVKSDNNCKALTLHSIDLKDIRNNVHLVKEQQIRETALKENLLKTLNRLEIGQRSIADDIEPIKNQINENTIKLDNLIKAD